jgi:hypothetical protein
MVSSNSSTGLIGRQKWFGGLTREEEAGITDRLSRIDPKKDLYTEVFNYKYGSTTGNLQAKDNDKIKAFIERKFRLQFNGQFEVFISPQPCRRAPSSSPISTNLVVAPSSFVSIIYFRVKIIPPSKNNYMDRDQLSERLRAYCVRLNEDGNFYKSQRQIDVFVKNSCDFFFSLPDSAPELYRDYDDSTGKFKRRVSPQTGAPESIVSFLERVWIRWIDEGVLTRPDFKRLDPQGEIALRNFLRAHGEKWPARLYLPTRSEALQRDLDKYEQEREKYEADKQQPESEPLEKPSLNWRLQAGLLRHRRSDKGSAR